MYLSASPHVGGSASIKDRSKRESWLGTGYHRGLALLVSLRGTGFFSTASFSVSTGTVGLRILGPMSGCPDNPIFQVWGREGGACVSSTRDRMLAELPLRVLSSLPPPGPFIIQFLSLSPQFQPLLLGCSPDEGEAATGH